MKRLLALLLAIAMLFGLTACTEEEIGLAADLITSVLAESEDDGSPQQTTTTAAKKTTAAATSKTSVQSTTAQVVTTKASTTAKVTTTTVVTTTATTAEPETPQLDPDGWYYSAKDVSLYLYTYGCLPSNFMTKKEARDLGWEGGSVEQYAEGYAIGGDKFGNREGKLPKVSGRTYYECDIDTLGEDERGPKRIVYSNDGQIYYTPDHYETFILLYGEE